VWLKNFVNLDLRWFFNVLSRKNIKSIYFWGVKHPISSILKLTESPKIPKKLPRKCDHLILSLPSITLTVEQKQQKKYIFTMDEVMVERKSLH
jgi:hypothetical protein